MSRLAYMSGGENTTTPVICHEIWHVQSKVSVLEGAGGRAELVTVWTSDTESAPGLSPMIRAMPVSVEEPLLCHVDGGRGEREH